MPTENKQKTSAVKVDIEVALVTPFGPVKRVFIQLDTHTKPNTKSNKKHKVHLGNLTTTKRHTLLLSLRHAHKRKRQSYTCTRRLLEDQMQHTVVEFLYSGVLFSSTSPLPPKSVPLRFPVATYCAISFMYKKTFVLRRKP